MRKCRKYRSALFLSEYFLQTARSGLLVRPTMLWLGTCTDSRRGRGGLNGSQFVKCLLLLPQEMLLLQCRRPQTPPPPCMGRTVLIAAAAKKGKLKKLGDKGTPMQKWNPASLPFFPHGRYLLEISWICAPPFRYFLGTQLAFAPRETTTTRLR